MGNLENKLRNLENYKAIGQYLPSDHSRLQSLDGYIKETTAAHGAPLTVLDLGCGEGASADFFHQLAPKTVWHGVDIADSPEVKQRTRSHQHMKSFDGINLPYSDKYFDLIYCHTV